MQQVPYVATLHFCEDFVGGDKCIFLISEAAAELLRQEVKLPTRMVRGLKNRDRRDRSETEVNRFPS